MRLVPITLAVIALECSVFALCITPNLVFTSSQIALFDIPAFNGNQMTLQVMPDDYSKLVPPLPIPNRTVKRLRADDSAATSVKVGHRQAIIKKAPHHPVWGFLLFLSKIKTL